MSLSASGVLERDGEFACLRAATLRACQSQGSFILITGDAGTGKSTLLNLAEDLATSSGLQVLTGRGSELESGFPFGIALQLLEDEIRGSSPDRCARVFAEGARLAAPLFGLSGLEGDSAPEADGQYSVIHGLYW